VVHEIATELAAAVDNARGQRENRVLDRIGGKDDDFSADDFLRVISLAADGVRLYSTPEMWPVPWSISNLEATHWVRTSRFPLASFLAASMVFMALYFA